MINVVEERFLFLAKDAKATLEYLTSLLQEVFEPVTLQGTAESVATVGGSGHLLAQLPTQNDHFFFGNNQDTPGRDPMVMCIPRDNWPQLCDQGPTLNGIFHFPCPEAAKRLTPARDVWKMCADSSKTGSMYLAN